MSRKTKFTPEEKEQVVIDYLKGNKSRAQICEELCISSRTIQDWALIYRKHGIIGFSRKMRNRSYSKEFKIKVVEEYIRGEGSSIDLGTINEQIQNIAQKKDTLCRMMYN